MSDYLLAAIAVLTAFNLLFTLGNWRDRRRKEMDRLWDYWVLESRISTLEDHLVGTDPDAYVRPGVFGVDGEVGVSPGATEPG